MPASARPRYYEAARTYTGCGALLGVLALGFLIDVIVTGGGIHLLAWAIAATLVLGVVALPVYAARSLRSIRVTETVLQVGSDSVDRAEIVAVEREVDPLLPVLGRHAGDGLPRGSPGLAIQLTDGRVVVLPTRRPRELAAALELVREIPPIRPAEPSDLPLLPALDRRAEALFRAAGIDLPDLPLSVDEMHDAQAVFVAGRPPVGLAHIDEVDGVAHLAELAVDPDSMRHGIGSALLETACGWARARGYPAMTLLTYADVPWNAPFYRARGFRELAEITPELAELRDWERAAGLDGPGRRIAMRRDL
jgi:GNAT superfamily N-acetyltransferase